MTTTNSAGVTLTEHDIDATPIINEADNAEDNEQEFEVKIKAVIIYDDTGNYLLHGSSDQTPSEMFKSMQPIWDVDPSKEAVKFVEITMRLFKPTFEVRPYVSK